MTKQITFKYSATSSKGKVATRTSHREYATAVFGTHKDGTHGMLGFSRDEATARKSFASYTKYGWIDFEFVPTTREGLSH